MSNFIGEHLKTLLEKVFGEGLFVPKECFYEMAGRLPIDTSDECSLAVAAGANEKGIAHFHVFRREEDLKSWKHGACLLFTGNCYYDHGHNQETLSRDELDQVAKILEEPYRRHPDIINWQYLLYIWNDNNDLYEIPDDTKMPDYDYETITRCKERRRRMK